VSFDLPSVLGIVAGTSGLTGFIVKALVLNRLDALERSRDAMGVRFGEAQKRTEIWQAEREAIERYQAGRWPR
jgi:hypothetical protein